MGTAPMVEPTWIGPFKVAEDILIRAVGRELAAFMGEANVEHVPVDDQLTAGRVLAEMYASETGVPVTQDLIDEAVRGAKADGLEAWWEVEGSLEIRTRRNEMRAYIEGRTGRPLLPL